MARPVLAILLATIAGACSSDSPQEEPPNRAIAWSATRPAGRFITLRFVLPSETPNCATDSVTVIGPGITEPLALLCAGSGPPQFYSEISAPALPLPPLTYTFTATIGGSTKEHTATVNCHMAPPAGEVPAAGASVVSPVTLSWPRIGYSTIEYGIFVWSYSPVWVEERRSAVDQSTFSVSLSPGTYNWTLSQVPIGLYEGEAAMTCTSWKEGGEFTVP